MQTIKARDLTAAYLGLTITHMPPPAPGQKRAPIIITGTLNNISPLAVRDLTNEGAKDSGVIITIDADKFLLLPNQTVDFPDLAPSTLQLFTPPDEDSTAEFAARQAEEQAFYNALTRAAYVTVATSRQDGTTHTGVYTIDGPPIPASDFHTPRPPRRTASRTGFTISASAALLVTALSLKLAFSDPTLPQHLLAITGIACAGLLTLRLLHVGRRATHWTD